MKSLSRRHALVGAAAAVVPLPTLASTSDPVIGLVQEWYRVRAAYDRERERVDALRDQLPGMFKNWPGILVETRTSYVRDHSMYGVPRHIYVRTEETAREYFDQRRRGVRSVERKQEVDRTRDAIIGALRKYHDTKWAEYQRIGIPDGPTGEEEEAYWGPWFRRLDAAEDAIWKSPATTIEGVLAKVEQVAFSIRRNHRDYEGLLDLNHIDENEWRFLALAEEAKQIGGAS